MAFVGIEHGVFPAALTAGPTMPQEYDVLSRIDVENPSSGEAQTCNGPAQDSRDVQQSAQGVNE